MVYHRPVIVLGEAGGSAEGSGCSRRNLWFTHGSLTVLKKQVFYARAACVLE